MAIFKARKFRPFIAAIGFLILLPDHSAFAQSWSLSQLAQEAVLSNPTIAGKRYIADAAGADVDAAKWQRFPSPSVTASRDGAGNPNTLLSIQQPLWAGGKIDATIDAARQRYSASTSAISESQQTILGQIINAYVDALRWQAKVEVQKKILAQHQQLFDMINRRVMADASPAVDRDLAQSRIFQVSNDLSVASQSLMNALTQLSQLVGKPVGEVTPIDIDLVSVPSSKENAIHEAVAISPVLARLSYELAAAESDVTVQKSELMPKISVRYEHQQADLPFSFAYARIMLVFESQIGPGLSAVSGVTAANGRREAARQAGLSAIRDLEQQVAFDWDGLAFSKLQLGNAASASASSKEVFESYTRQFTAGRKSWLDVLNTVRESGQYELLVLDANAQMLGAKLRLSLWTGEITPLILH